MASQARAAPPPSPGLSGPAPLLQLPSCTAAELREAVRGGLPFTALLELARHLQLSPQHIASVLGIPPRTVARRKESRHLSPQESDRLYRVARVVSEASETLGSLEKARVWLKSPNRALACETPLDLLDTEIGARQVEDVLMRLNYGLFS